MGTFFFVTDGDERKIGLAPEVKKKKYALTLLFNFFFISLISNGLAFNYVSTDSALISFILFAAI